MHFSTSKQLLGGWLMVSLILGCKDSGKTTATEENQYFPVADYVRSQLHVIDSLQLPVTLYRSGVNGSDTSLLSTKECLEMAAPFQDPDITDPAVAARFTEASFADQSIPSVTFNYTTKDEKLPLKRVDVVLHPDPALAEKVRTIYMEKMYSSGDTLVEEKLFWNNDHYYQILRTSRIGSAPPALTQIKVVWDPTE
jgi:hypothetical protein